MDDLAALKRTRQSLKGHITRIQNWATSHYNVEKDPAQFFTRITNINSYFEQYNVTQDAIEHLAPAPPDDAEDRVSLENKYYDALSMLRNAHAQLMVPNAPIQAAVGSNTQLVNVRLPDISVQPFDGQDPRSWKGFFDIFNALIIHNHKLTNSERFYYLKSFLKGKALDVVNSLAISDDNFNVAIALLRETFENPNRTVGYLFHELLEICPLIKCNSESLRLFIISTKKALESLKNLNLTHENLFNSLVIHLLTLKLDYGTKRAFEEDRDITKLASIDELFTFLERKCVILENLNGFDLHDDRKIIKNKSAVNLHSRVHAQPNSQSSYAPTQVNCIFCNDRSHKVYLCPRFNAMSPNERHAFIKSKNYCFNCLGTKHTTNNCLSNFKCSICNLKHHSLLHLNNGAQWSNSRPVNPRPSNFPNVTRTSQTNATAANGTVSAGTNMLNRNSGAANRSAHVSTFVNNNSFVLLATCIANVTTGYKKLIPARILLDNGSQNSFITKEFANKLNLRSYNKHLNISGIFGGHSGLSSYTLDLTISSRFEESTKFTTPCAIVEKITNQLPQAQINVQSLKIPDELLPFLGDPDFGTPNDINILIGADLFYEIILPEHHKLGTGLPTMVNTRLGWILSGGVPESQLVPSYQRNSHCFLSIDNSPNLDPLESLLTRFWTQEELCDTPAKSIEDELIEKMFIENTRILQNGRYQVDMPLKSPKEYLKLGESFFLAKKRFITLEKRFEKDPSLFLEYKSFIDEYLSLGHGEYVPLALTNINAERKIFVPHLCVLREHSASTRLRVVFDFSCKTTTSLSLNDVTFKGFPVQPELYDILCRFRSFKYVLTSDITKMYRQVLINPTQHFLQNILWRESPNEEFQCIELKTLSFGQNFAPYMATRTLNDIAENNKNKYPLAAEALFFQTFVDDILAGADTVHQLHQLHNELLMTLNPSGFELHKFGSNSKEFLADIEQFSSTEVELNSRQSCCKVLGLKWNPNNDKFQISVPMTLELNPVTKRRILSYISQMFDPLGLINPLIVNGKILMQKLWLMKVGWDTKIQDPHIIKEWSLFIENVNNLKSLEIPRGLFTNNSIARIDLHGFSDASQLCYGAVVYVRTAYDNGQVSCSLLTSKSRVAPIKKLCSIPRLELCGMVLLSQLINKVINIFQNKFKITSINLWSDSQISLYWIQSIASRWTPYVANRVSQIQQLTENYCWRYIPSKKNPADVLSRGIFNSKITKMWFDGPEFLLDPNFNINSFLTPLNNFADTNKVPEERKIALPAVALPTTFWERAIDKFSTFSELQRTIAYMLRFLHGPRNSNAFSITELNTALHLIIKNIQGLHFKKLLNEIKTNKIISDKHLLSLCPFIDANGLLRVGGRLNNADIPFDQKHPLLLPSNVNVVYLLLKKEHIRLGHSGPQTVLSNVRLRFWPLNGLREIKKVIYNCVTCKRFKPQLAAQIMASLPSDRVNIARPFERTGIDFGGPFLLKSSRLRKAPTVKSYIAVFICMVTKAIHIELVSDLTTKAFLASLQRFISRRGNPSVIYTDNGLNFVGASNELRELYKFFDSQTVSDTIADFLSRNETLWKFIPPSSPHWGGLWEAAVKSAKFHLYRIMGSAKFTFEELTTILTQVEAILNSRPLCALSSDPSECNVLTPGHFLIGTPLMAYPGKDVTAIPDNRLSFWEQCNKIKQLFWKKWLTDYLNRLQNRPKWIKPFENLKPNDIVLIKDENAPPLKWPLARIVEVMPGKDGKVRVVKVVTADGTYIRPIAKVCPLVVDNDIPNDGDNSEVIE